MIYQGCGVIFLLSLNCLSISLFFGSGINCYFNTKKKFKKTHTQGKSREHWEFYLDWSVAALMSHDQYLDIF